MRVVAGRWPIDRSKSKQQQTDWDNEPTTVSPIKAFEEDVGMVDDVVSGNIIASRPPPQQPDVDADTVLDDRSIDEMMNFALGTDERRMHEQQPSRRASTRSSGSMPVQALQTVQPVQVVPVVYPTAPGGYVQYVPQPPYPTAGYPTGYPQVAAPPPPLRARTGSRIAVAAQVVLALGVTAILGVAVGKYLFSDAAARIAQQPQPAAPAAAPQQPVAAAQQPVAAAQQPAQPAAAPVAAPVAQPQPAAAPVAPAPVAPVTVAVASLEHPEGAAALKAPAGGGVVSKSWLEGTREVKKDEKLFELTRKSGPSAKSKKLAARVKELEGLAEEDPVYKAFLEKARVELREAGGGGGTQVVLVKAQADGVLKATIAKGDRVDGNQTLATGQEAGTWIAKATVTGATRPSRDWSCQITDADGKQKAECALDAITDAQAGADVTVKIDAAKAAWLAVGGKAQLVLAPR